MSYANGVNPLTNKPIRKTQTGEVAQQLNYSEKQVGKKFGEHMNPNLEGYRDSKEYLQLAKDIYSSPEATKIIYRPNAARYAGETHYYMKNGNLLRLDSNGNFRSLYNLNRPK